LFDEVSFTVKLWKENCTIPTSLTCNLKQRLDPNKIGLIVEHALTAALENTSFTLELWTFHANLCGSIKPTLLQNHTHPLENSCKPMAFWVV
jgi:hypothetical protein